MIKELMVKSSGIQPMFIILLAKTLFTITICFCLQCELELEKNTNFLIIFLLEGILHYNQKKILEFSAHFNQYFQHKEPWKNGKGTNTCVYLSANAVRSIAIALYPFIPESAQKIWIQLGMEGNVSEQSWDSMSKLSIKDGHTLGIPSPLFVKVEESDIEKHKKKLGNKN